MRPDIRAFDHSSSLLPILKSFQENEFKLAIVTEVPTASEDDDHFKLDPRPRVIGVVSQEDIVEDILQGEIQDEGDLVETKNQRVVVKQKLVLMFTDKRAGQVLNQAELHAVREFLENDLGPF